jgi:hypothetical protein
MITPTTTPVATTLTIEQGLNFILGHFQDQDRDQPIFPRSISTKTTEGRQILVNSEKEALARFTQANYQDCRISAYPPNGEDNPSEVAKFQGIQKSTPTNLLIMIDLDRSNFETDRALQVALTRTLQNIKDKLDPAANPTVIWSGRGYHIYLVIGSNGVNLEYEQVFTNLTGEPSRKFLQFAEHYLSFGKSDKSHNTTVSFRNCMLRVPGSINSKNGQPIRVIQKWNGLKPVINYLLADFCIYLANEKAQEIQRQTQARKSKSKAQTNMDSSANSRYINWIEQLLQTPIADHRKYCIWRVLSPYLLNIKKLPEQEAFNIIKEWLQHCSELQRLSFSVSQRITDGLDGAAKRGYLPISLEKLKEENNRLYSFLHVSGVVDCRQ